LSRQYSNYKEIGNLLRISYNNKRNRQLSSMKKCRNKCNSKCWCSNKPMGLIIAKAQISQFLMQVKQTLMLVTGPITVRIVKWIHLQRIYNKHMFKISKVPQHRMIPLALPKNRISDLMLLSKNKIHKASRKTIFSV